MSVLSCRAFSLGLRRCAASLMVLWMVTAVWPVAAQTPGADDARLRPDTMQARVAACTACHGEQGRAGTDGYYPRLAGKSLPSTAEFP
jgi:cytochrome c553